MRGRQKPVVRPAPHDIAEIDQKGAGDDRRRKPFSARWPIWRQPHRQPRHLGARQRGHKAVVGMRPLAKEVVFDRLLRRVVQEAQGGVRLVGEIRREKLGRHAQRHGEGRQHPVAHRPERVEISYHVPADLGQARRPLVAAAQRRAGDHLGMVGAAVMADEKALVLVRPGRFVDGRGALHRGIDRQIADIVVVEPERQLLRQGQGMKPARGGKGALDQFVANAVVQRIEEADLRRRRAPPRPRPVRAPPSRRRNRGRNR